jgi:hypothetical protein
MMHYQLRCADNHAFDGWFKGSASFDQQAAQGLIACPVCGGTQVSRALMAPAVRSSRKAAATVDQNGAPAAATPAPEPVAGPMPDHVRAMLQKLRAEVERSCAYVGPTFADEARRIHNGEATERPIYGEATPDQAEALAEDGIQVARIPWVPRADG